MSRFSRSGRKQGREGSGQKAGGLRGVFFRPRLEALEDRTLLNNRLDPLSNALSASLDQLDTSFRALVSQSQAALPVLNQPLGSVAELRDTVDRFQSAILTTLRGLPESDLAGAPAQARSKIQDALWKTLHEEENILGDRDGGGVTKEDVFVGEDLNLDTGNVTIELRLTGSVNVASQRFTFGTGLPGIPFEIDSHGELSVTAGVDYKSLRFGLTNGRFFLDTSGVGEITAGVTASLRNASMTGVVGFLAVNARPAGVTQLTADLNLDVIGTAPNIQIASPRLTGAADVNLTLESSLAALTDKAPSIATDFRMHWDFNGGDPRYGPGSLGAEPSVTFDNVRVAMGSFVSGVVGPVVKNIQTALAPIQPVLSVLNYRIPGLSDLVEFGGGGPVSLLTLAKAASAIGALPSNVELLVRLADTVNDLNNAVRSIAITGNNVWLPVGSFNLNQYNDDLRGLPAIGSPGQSLRSFAANLDPLQNVSALNSFAGGNLASLEQLVNNADENFLSRAAKDQLGKLIDRIKNKLERLDNGFKLEFPVLQNPAEGAFKLLLGQNIDFVTFTGQYHFDARVEETYNMFKVLLFQVKGFLRGDIDLDLFFKMGYDSLGLRLALKPGANPVDELAKGLFIDTSRELIHLNGGVSIGVAGEIPLIGFTDPIFGETIGVSAGVEFSGGLSINNFKFLLSTASPDRKFRIDTNADRLFDTAGTVNAGIKFEVVAHTPIPLLDDIVLYSKTIASHTLIDLNSDFHRANPFKPPAGSTPERVPVITDLNAFPEANDGVPNRVYLEEVNGQYVLSAFNGSSTVPFFTSTPKPVGAVESITVLGGSDDDAFYPRKVGGTRFLAGLPVTIDGRGGHNSLEVRTSAPLASRSNFVFSNGHVSGPFELSYKGIDEITAYAVGGLHTSRILEVEDGLRLTIYGSSHSNSFIVGNGQVGGITGKLALYGGSGTDTLEFDDRNNPFAARWVVTDTSVRRMTNYFTIDPPDFRRTFHVATVELALNAIDGVTIRGGTTSIHIVGLGEDVNRFELLATNLPVTVIGGTSSDHYVIGSEGFQTRSPVYSNISITDRGGENDSLALNERGVKFPTLFGLPPHVVYTVNTTSITRRETSSSITDIPTTYAISGLEDVRLYGGNYPGTEYRVAGFKGGGSNSVLSVYTGTESDVVTLGTFPAGLSNLKSNVLLYDAGGDDRLVVNAKDVALAAGRAISPNGTEDTYTADGRLVSPNGTEVTYTNYENLFIRAPLGQSSVTVQSVAENVNATIFGAKTVNLGGGRLADLRGAVDVQTDDGRWINSDGYRGNATTSLRFDDSRNNTPGSYTIGATSFAAVNPDGSPAFGAAYGGAAVRFLTFYGGSGGNAVTLTGTQPFANTLITWLYTGAGADTVNVETTRTNVFVHGQGGEDVVNLGKGGSVQGITGSVRIDNAGGFSTITVDDSADATPRAVRLDREGDDGTVRGLAPGLITYRGWETRAVNIRGGTGGNTFDVVNTFPEFAGSGGRTTLYAGAGSDKINVIGTTSPLTVDPQGGSNLVTIGGRPGSSGDLTGLYGEVTLRGEPGVGRNDVDVIDRALPADFVYEMDDRRLRRVAQTVLGTRVTTINHADFPFASLDLYAGNGNNRFEISGTPSAANGVTLTSGRGVDSVELLGTNSALSINLGAGLGQTVTVGDATHSLDSIRAPITLHSIGTISRLWLNDSADTESHAVVAKATKSGQTFQRTNDGGTELNVVIDVQGWPIQDIEFDGGSGGTTMYVESTAAGTRTTFVGHEGVQDVLTVGFGNNTLGDVKGAVEFYGQAGDQDFAYYYDYNKPNSEKYTFSTTGLPGALLARRAGVAPVWFHNLARVRFFTPQVGRSTVYVSGSPEQTSIEMYVSDGDLVLLGSNAPILGGTLSAIRGPIVVNPAIPGRAAKVILDDSGDSTGHDFNVKSVNFSGYPPLVTIEREDAGTIYVPDDPSWVVDVYGGNADDRFLMGGKALSAQLSIDGGGGVNTLDYSGYDGSLPNLVSWYRGEGDAADSVGNNRGTLHGDAGFAPGKVGQAFDFDGAGDYVDLGSGPSLDLPGSMTVALWVRLDTLDHYKYFLADFVSDGVTSQGSLGAGSTPFWSQSTPFWFQSYTDGSFDHLVATTPLQLGRWYHLSVVRDDSAKTVRIYVNGVEEATISYAGKAVVPLQGSKILGGSAPPFPSDFMDGQLDEVGIFNRALSAAEVRALYSGSAGGLPGDRRGVTVNLPLGTASGLRGVANIKNVVGSAGDDVLVGNGGGAVSGGAGRDLLIGGPGADRLDGGAGEDILAAGATAYDLAPDALDALMAEWGRIDLPYGDRVDHLLNGGGRNGATRLDLAHVASDAGLNSLTGGADLDLFLGSLRRDASDWDRASGEIFIDLERP